MSEETPISVPARRLQPSASYSFTMRLHLPQPGAAFALVAHAIAEAEAVLGAIDLVRGDSNEVVRDVTVACVDSGHAEAVVRGGARARGRARRRSPGRTVAGPLAGAILVALLALARRGGARRRTAPAPARHPARARGCRRGRASCASMAGACSWSGDSPTAGAPSAPSWADSSGASCASLAPSRARPRGARSVGPGHRPRGRLARHGRQLGGQPSRAGR